MPIYYRNAVPKLGGMENCNLTIILQLSIMDVKT